MKNSTVDLLLRTNNNHERIAILLHEGLTQENIIQILHVSSKTITKVKHALDNGEEIPECGKRGQPTKKVP